MRYLFIAIYKKSLLWFSFMMIPYCIFSSFLFEYPALIFIIRVILAIALSIIAIGGMMSYLFPYIEILKQPLKGKGLIRALYLKSDKIITRLYCCFLVVYIAFSIEYKSTLYNYLLLLLIGLFLGYKITMKAEKYTLEEINKKMGKTILLVTHDPIIASSCDRIIFLKDGKVKEDLKRTGDKEQFYNEIIANWC